MHWSADIEAIAIYVLAGLLSAALLLGAHKISRANRADTQDAISTALAPVEEKVDKLAVELAELRGEINGGRK